MTSRTVQRSAALACASALVVAMLLPDTAHSQTWPSKPLNLIVPLAPGGAVDVLARQIARSPARSGASR